MAYRAYPMPHAGLLAEDMASRRSSAGEVPSRPSPYEIEDRRLSSMFSFPQAESQVIKVSKSKPGELHLCQIGAFAPVPRIVSPTRQIRANAASPKTVAGNREVKQTRGLSKQALAAQKRLLRMPLATLAFDVRVPANVKGH